MNTQTVLANVNRVNNKDQTIQCEQREAFQKETFDVPVCTAITGFQKTFIKATYCQLSKELTDIQLELLPKSTGIPQKV